MRYIIVWIALCGILGMVWGCKQKAPEEEADFVLRNGKILTMDSTRSQVEALAARGDRLLAVGSDRDIEPYIEESTEVIDLEGKLAVPGLIDGHGHYMTLGESLMGVDLRKPQTWEEIVDLVAAAVKKVKPGEWIVGRGWHQDKWEKTPSPSIEGLPVHHELSAVSPQNPVMLIHVSGHGIFVNAAALEFCNITRDTPDPPGGEIVRDGGGEPTGMLRETAQDVVREKYADYRQQRPSEVIEKELRLQVELAGEEAIANGITTFHDMGETFAIVDLMKTMADEENLPLRLYVAIDEPSEVMQAKLAEYRMVGYGNGYLTVRMIGERVLDGALGTHGGWLLEPYSDMPRSLGFNVIPVDEIRQSAELAAQHGYQMAIQGIGDRATRELLNIYEDIFRKNPDKKDFRWRVEHCQVVHPEDLKRFAQLGVIASVRGIFATSDGPWVIKRLGEKRARERGYLYQTMLKSGIVVVNGTDPPVEDIDPVANFYATVTRKMANGEVFFPEQKLTRQQALETYTLHPAFAAFEENIKGSLEPGKLADITVFSKDLLTIPEDEILDTEVVYTIIGGKVKYRKAEP
ncbi:MAG: amidohydrolase family protein [Candidatus Aminicenantes bacterium]